MVGSGRQSGLPGAASNCSTVDLPGDVRPVDWSADGRRIVLEQWHRATGSLALYDTEKGTVTPLPSPGGVPAEWLSAELHGSAVTSVWSDAERPYSAWELEEGHARRLLTVAEPDSFRGASWENVEFPSADGTLIQGRPLRPPGKGPWPSILHGHGGPTAAMTAQFSPTCQAWVDNGFAVLSVNYRGSTTFGDGYREALTRHIGEVDVADMMAGHAWLLASGVADPDMIIVSGYSYGGYLALHCPALHPEAFAGAVAGAPVADWLLIGEDQNAFLDAYDRALFGGDRSETAELHRRASPRTYVDRYRAPVLISTPLEERARRCNHRSKRTSTTCSKEHGKEVRLDRLEGGHARRRDPANIRMMESWIQFARDILPDGRSRIGGPTPAPQETTPCTPTSSASTPATPTDLLPSASAATSNRISFGAVEVFRVREREHLRAGHRRTSAEQDVFLVQPTSRPVNESIMELLIMIDAFKRASAGRIRR